MAAPRQSLTIAYFRALRRRGCVRRNSSSPTARWSRDITSEVSVCINRSAVRERRGDLLLESLSMISKIEAVSFSCRSSG